MPRLQNVFFIAACLAAFAGHSGDERFREELSRSLTANGKPWILRPEEITTRAYSAPEGQVWDLRPFAGISASAQRSDKTLGGLRLRWIVTSRIGGAYQALLAIPVSSAAPAELTLDFSTENSVLIPTGHQRPWDALAAANVIRIELRPECTFSAVAENAITLALGRLQLIPAKAPPPVAILDLQLFDAPSGLHAEAELSFRIHPMPVDPFSAEGDGDVRLRLPDGKVALAFVDQNFSFVQEGAYSRAVPSGEPYFRVYLPKLPKNGSLALSVAGNEWPLDLTALLARKREARRAPDFPPARWQPELTTVFPSMAPHGLPVFPSALLSTGRFQIAAKELPTQPCWRPMPYWTSAWNAFHGTALPSLELAARMDSELSQAVARGETRPFVLMDGALLERSGAFNWANHPLRPELSGPAEFFRHEEGQRFARRWARYCLARWGRSKAVDDLWLTLDTLAPGDGAFFKTLAPALAEWSSASPGRVFAIHPFAAESKPAQTIATFDGKDSAVWFADTRHGLSTGARMQQGTDGPHGFEIRARGTSEKNLGLTADFSRIRIQWNEILPDNLSAGDTLLFDVRIPEDGPPDLRLGIHVRDRDELWFQTLLPAMPQPGDWSTFALDLSDRNAHGLKPIGHAKAWTGYSRQRISEIGLHLYSTHKDWIPPGSDQPRPLQASIDHIRLIQRPTPPLEAPKIALLKQFVFQGGSLQAVDPAQAAIGDLFKCDLSVNRSFENPFDPTQCDLTAVIELPSGKTVRVPLFFNQPCVRSEAELGGDEVVQPVGGEIFSLRYRIVEAGPHRVSVEWREGGRYESKREWFSDQRYTPEGKAQSALGRGRGGMSRYPELFDNGKRPVDTVRFVPGQIVTTLDMGKAAFTAGTPQKPFRGFVRVASDRRHFEFDDGSFYYPLGPCARSPSDRRIAYNSEKFLPDEIDRIGRRGTYQYDDYFAEYEKAGINWARVWMCSWWGALEWRRDWPGYQGVGRYNLLNAWRIDHLLAEAEKRGIYISLCLTNHGQFALYVDAEWENNPYNARLGGPLTTASEFFSAREAKILHQNKLRYVLARYGHSPAIATWALFSELEWTEEYEPSMRADGNDPPSPILDQWHTEMAGFLREHDPNKHLTLTHYSHPKHGNSTLQLPAVDVAASNAYSAFPDFGVGRFDAGFALASFWAGYEDGELKGFERFGKPALVEEQGRHWMGGRNNTQEDLDADLHAQLWGGVVQPLAGATGYWWWVQLHTDKRYEKYAALSRFLKGEDFRPAKGETLLEPAYRNVPAKDGQLFGRALKSSRRLYAWIFHPSVPRGGNPAPVSGGEIRVGGMEAGVYTFEAWDTYAGKMIEQREITIPVKDGKPESITIQLPVVRRDIAIKFKLRK